MRSPGGRDGPAKTASRDSACTEPLFSDAAHADLRAYCLRAAVGIGDDGAIVIIESGDGEGQSCIGALPRSKSDCGVALGHGDGDIGGF